jgi:hypothetical protein
MQDNALNQQLEDAPLTVVPPFSLQYAKHGVATTMNFTH